MISKLKKIVKNNKTILQNMSYLSFLQVFNLLIPLLTYPYLIRILGLEKYGLVVFAQAVVGYFVILVSFGFNISATKEISINRDNKSKINEIVSSTLLLKGFLFVFSVIIFSITLNFFNQAQDYKLLFYLSLYLCLYEWLFPIWYFQGLEKMKYITILNLISRSIFLVLIFILIETQDDYLLVPIITGIGCIIASITGLFIIFYIDKIKLILPTSSVIKFYFKESVPIFISNVSVKLYVSSNKIIIGSFLGMSDVAYYDLAEKLLTILRMPQGIFSQVLFPKVCKDKNISFVKKMFKISLWSNIGIYALSLFMIKPIILLLGGEEMLPSFWVFVILGLTLPLTAMSNILGVQLLLPFGYKNEFSKVIVLSGLVYLVLIIFTKYIFNFSIENISLVTVLTEIFVTILMFNYCLKFNLWKKNTITLL